MSVQAFKDRMREYGLEAKLGDLPGILVESQLAVNRKDDEQKALARVFKRAWHHRVRHGLFRPFWWVLEVTRIALLLRLLSAAVDRLEGPPLPNKPLDGDCMKVAGLILRALDIGPRPDEPADKVGQTAQAIQRGFVDLQRALAAALETPEFWIEFGGEAAPEPLWWWERLFKNFEGITVRQQVAFGFFLLVLAVFLTLFVAWR